MCNERKEAVEILLRIFYKGAYSSVLLQQTFKAHPEWDSRNRAFITNLVNTVLNHNLRLESMMNLYSKKPARKLKPYVAMVLMVSEAQLLWMDKIPESAVVDEAVKLILHSPYRILSGFVNGVLRSMIRANLRESWPEAGEDLIAHLSIRYSIPRWMLELWERSYGIETTKLLARNLNCPRDLSIRCNTMKIMPQALCDRLQARLGKENVRRGGYAKEALVLKNPGDITGLEEFRQGLFTVQDESSMLCTYALDPQKGERILDLCAAPGGKSSHIAEKMEDQGIVSSRDIHPYKVEMMKLNAKRLGLGAIRPELGDAGLVWEEDRQAWDRVLLDAPCSGLGIIRNKPDLKLHRTMDELKKLIPIQRKFLHTASECVRPGGVLVYSTCTLHPGENEENAEWFLQSHPEFESESLEGYLPEGFPREQIHPHYAYIMPEKEFLDGFFIARFRKKR